MVVVTMVLVVNMVGGGCGGGGSDSDFISKLDRNGQQIIETDRNGQ